MHCKAAADALVFISKITPARYKLGAKHPDRYNIVGDLELDNLQAAKMVAIAAGKPLNYRLVASESARPGYDRRYALDGSKLAAVGWRSPIPTAAAIERVVKWTLENPHWVA